MVFHTPVLPLKGAFGPLFLLFSLSFHFLAPLHGSHDSIAELSGQAVFCHAVYTGYGQPCRRADIVPEGYKMRILILLRHLGTA